MKRRSSGSPRSIHSKLLLIILLVVSNWCAFSFAEWYSSPTRGLPKVSVFGSDAFDEPASGEVGSSEFGLRWSAIGGVWGFEGSGLRLKQASAEVNLLLVEAGPRASIRAKVVGGSYCGLVANVFDSNNYVALLRAKPFGVWNVVEVVDGESKLLGKVPDSWSDLVNAELRVGEGRVWAFVEEAVASFSIKSDQIGTAAGFAQAKDGSAPCIFDDALVMAKL